MKIATLFDGAGLARLGLEQAGHECTGVELDPIKVHLGRSVGSGNVIHADVLEWWPKHRKEFDAVWASPPCARRTSCIKDLTRADGLRNPEFQHDLLLWCQGEMPTTGPSNRRNLPNLQAYWIENVTQQGAGQHENAYNAAQFLKVPIQCRNRLVLGRFPEPRIWRPYYRAYPDLNLCPAITATEYKASGATDKCRASRFYGRNLTIEECAYHQGFKVPRSWWEVPTSFASSRGILERHAVTRWKRKLYEAIGDGVPVYMARAFGEALK